MSKITLLDFGSDYQSKQNLNANNTALRAALAKAVYRDGTSPNQMLADFDMNSNHILNVADATLGHEAVNLDQVTALISAAGGAPTSTVVANVANYTALRALGVSALTAGALIYVQGHTTLNDGGQGFFTHQTTVLTEDYGTQLVSNTAGHYFKRVYVGPVVDLWFGVVADGVTDNSVALQRAEDAAAAGPGVVYYPKRPLARKFTTQINTYVGVKHQGDVSSTAWFTLGANHADLWFYQADTTKNAWMIENANGLGAYEAPKWYDLNIACEYGGVVRLNNRAHGFTDDNTSQIAFNNVRIERCVFLGNQRGNSCINLSKCLDIIICQNVKFFFDYGLEALGCDNMEVSHNHFNSAFVCEVYATAQGSFGNDHWIKDNILSTPYIASFGQLFLSSRSFFVEDNYFECQYNLDATGAMITLNSGIVNGVIQNNQMDGNVAQCPNWLRVTTPSFLSLKLENNFDTAGDIGPAFFYDANIGTSATGVLAYVNALRPTYITGGKNPATDGGIPFFAKDVKPINHGIPTVTGQTLWNIGPAFQNVTSVYPYYTSLKISPQGEYVLPYAAASANKIGLNGGPDGPGNLTATVDVWIEARSDTGTPTVTIGMAGVDYTQALTTTLTWYKVANNVAVAALTEITARHSDAANTTKKCQIRNIKVMVH